MKTSKTPRIASYTDWDGRLTVYTVRSLTTEQVESIRDAADDAGDQVMVDHCTDLTSASDPEAIERIEGYIVARVKRLGYAIYATELAVVS